MAYVVEKRHGVDVYGADSDIVRCEDFPALKAAWEDLAARDCFEAHAEAGELARGEVDFLGFEDPDTGDEVTARPA